MQKDVLNIMPKSSSKNFLNRQKPIIFHRLLSGIANPVTSVACLLNGHHDVASLNASKFWPNFFVDSRKNIFKRFFVPRVNKNFSIAPGGYSTFCQKVKSLYFLAFERYDH